MRCCYNVSPSGLAHISGINTLDLSQIQGWWITDGLIHLKGINKLILRECNESTIKYAQELGLPWEV
jgi:hypothetical protein